MDIKKFIEIITLIDLIKKLYDKFVGKKEEQDETTQDETSRFQEAILSDCIKNEST